MEPDSGSGELDLGRKHVCIVSSTLRVQCREEGAEQSVLHEQLCGKEQHLLLPRQGKGVGVMLWDDELG